MPPATPSAVQRSRLPTTRLLADVTDDTLREQVAGTLLHLVMAVQTAPARRGKRALGMAGAAHMNRVFGKNVFALDA